MQTLARGNAPCRRRALRWIANMVGKPRLLSLGGTTVLKGSGDRLGPSFVPGADLACRVAG